VNLITVTFAILDTHFLQNLLCVVACLGTYGLNLVRKIVSSPYAKQALQRTTYYQIGGTC
jgi:hypothetical protein